MRDTWTTNEVSIPARRLAWLTARIGIAAVCIWTTMHAGTALVVTREALPPDAIIMLASHEWERLPAAAALARQFPASVVLLTVPRVVTTLNCYRCGERVDWLEREGVPKSRIRVLPYHVVNTHDEALAALDYATSCPVRRLAVVTSPYHTRRALATFQTVLAGTPVNVGVMPATGTSPAEPGRWWWHRYDRHYVAYEWAAILSYRVKFGVPMS